MDALQGFTVKQAIFITEYAKTDNMTQACAAAGINRGTGYNYMAKREYQHAVQEIRNRAVASAWTSLSAGLQTAVDTVMDVLNSDTATNNVRLRAAELIINQARILTEEQEIIARLDRLEVALGEG